MTDLLATAPTRAGLFFLAGFVVATVGGLLVGDLRLGLATGASAGLLLATFGALFVRPIENDPGPAPPDE